MASKTLQGYLLMLALLTLLIIGWRLSVNNRRKIEQREKTFQKTLLEELGKMLLGASGYRTTPPAAEPRRVRYGQAARSISPRF